MPAAGDILRVLGTMAGDLAWLAIAWHVVLAALLLGWPLSRRVGRALLVSLALSVAAASLTYRSLFNAGSFAVLAMALAVGARDRRGAAAPAWGVVLGVALIAYGWVYPHFTAGPWYRSLYAAPVGVVPCPTLAVLGGLALATAGPGSRAELALLAGWCAFYALFGIFRLGVALDAGLMVGAVGLAVRALFPAVTARDRARFPGDGTAWSHSHRG